MNTLTRSTKASRFVFALAALLMLSAGVASSRSTATAQGNINGNSAEEFIFGSVGITPMQTARLNIVNTATDGRTQTRVLKFLDSAGNVIIDSSGNSVVKTVTLAPGESAYLDFNGADIPGGGRVQIRALDPTCSTCGRESPRGVIQTLELIDNVTRRTDVLYAPAQFMPPGQNVGGPFGMVGITAGHTARLSVTTPPDPIAPNDPMRVLLGFAKANGQPVTNADGFPMQMEVMLHAGESAFFDLPASFVLAAGETRAEIRPVLAPEGPPVRRLIPTLEVIENCGTCSGKTVVLYAPVARTCGAGQ
jgi:hypothetical protein